MKDGRVHNGQASAKQKPPGGNGCKLVLTRWWWYREITVGFTKRIQKGLQGSPAGLRKGFQ